MNRKEAVNARVAERENLMQMIYQMGILVMLPSLKRLLQEIPSKQSVKGKTHLISPHIAP